MTERMDNQDLLPMMPRTVGELDVPEVLIRDLFLRRLKQDGLQTLSSMSGSLKLATSIVEHVFDDLRQRHIVEVKGMEGDDFRFSLTAAGEELAKARMATSEYAGAAPVSLPSYTRRVRAQFKRIEVGREALRELFSDIVVTDEMLDALGPALVTQDSLFLYGPTGGGKTTVAERLLRIYDDFILVPAAVEVDGQIIVVYDPGIHRRRDDISGDFDPRWIPCERPCVSVGGELTTEMLDLRRDTNAGIFIAPLQMKANNGMLIIDDFGRQAIRADRLLNRWIVPLDRRVDYLSLNYGVKFDVPFELMVVFSTNLEPLELADEAFLRRIRNKVFIGPTEPEVFERILESVAAKHGFEVKPGIPEVFQRTCMETGPGILRACYPRDLCEIILANSIYEGRPGELTEKTISEAASLYFTRRLSS